MIITLPRRVEYLTHEAVFPHEIPLFRLSPVKSGLMAYNNHGQVVGQIFNNAGKVAVTLADGGCIVLTKKGTGVEFSEPIYEEKTGLNEEKKRSLGAELIFFGNAETAHYEIFIQRKGEQKPTSFLTAVAHPIYEKLLNVKINDDENVLRAVMLCMAIGYFE